MILRNLVFTLSIIFFGIAVFAMEEIDAENPISENDTAETVASESNANGGASLEVTLSEDNEENNSEENVGNTSEEVTSNEIDSNNYPADFFNNEENSPNQSFWDKTIGEEQQLEVFLPYDIAYKPFYRNCKLLFSEEVFTNNEQWRKCILPKGFMIESHKIDGGLFREFKDPKGNVRLNVGHYLIEGDSGEFSEEVSFTAFDEDNKRVTPH